MPERRRAKHPTTSLADPPDVTEWLTYRCRLRGAVQHVGLRMRLQDLQHSLGLVALTVNSTGRPDVLFVNFSAPADRCEWVLERLQLALPDSGVEMEPHRVTHPAEVLPLPAARAQDAPDAMGDKFDRGLVLIEAVLGRLDTVIERLDARSIQLDTIAEHVSVLPRMDATLERMDTTLQRVDTTLQRVDTTLQRVDHNLAEVGRVLHRMDRNTQLTAGDAAERGPPADIRLPPQPRAADEAE